VSDGGPVGVAVVGCGAISGEYLQNLASFPDVTVLCCADLDPGRAKAQAAAFGVPSACGTAEALGHPGVELVVNLTVPAAHAQVAGAAVAAGKHVWNEKPLAVTLAEATALLAAARRAGVRVGCAPDTLLGPGFQSAARVIRAGAIGEPLSALALTQDPGPESWHPDPEPFYAPGAGPLFDVGVYYLSALAALFGPARRVAAVGRTGRADRLIATGPRAGAGFGVSVPTHVAALAEYGGGQAASLLFSFDSPLIRHGFCEITGSEATLSLPSPSKFGGDLRLRPRDATGWTALPVTGSAATRGTGVLDMARAIRSGEPQRAPADLALHVLETMLAVERSAATGAFEPVSSSFTPPELLPPTWDPCAAMLVVADRPSRLT
jgi:predicted dehydrogenase